MSTTCSGYEGLRTSICITCGHFAGIPAIDPAQYRHPYPAYRVYLASRKAIRCLQHAESSARNATTHQIPDTYDCAYAIIATFDAEPGKMPSTSANAITTDKQHCINSDFYSGNITDNCIAYQSSA